MDEALLCGFRRSTGPPGAGGRTTGKLRRNQAVDGSSAVDVGCRDREQVCPTPAAFCVAVVVGQAADDSVESLAATEGVGAVLTKQEEEVGVQRHRRQQAQQREPLDQQLQQDLHQRRVSLRLQEEHHQDGCRGQREQQQQKGRDGHGRQQAPLEPVEELKRSISGLRRVSSLTRLSSGEIRTWETFLLPTAAAALSVPMLVLVGSAPVFCMILFITCMQNVLAAMFMMHWVCMVAVPLLYVKFVERSFDYYTHVWAVQSCRFAAQWKRALLLGCGTAGCVYCIYRLLRCWGGAWFAALVDNARSRALAAGLDLPFASLLAVACYFCICNPIIEEWFWRIFLYREFGGAVFFSAENRRGLFLLRETPPVPRKRSSSINDGDAALFSAAPVDLGGSSPGAGAFRKAERSMSFTAATDAYNYQELRDERELAPDGKTHGSTGARPAANRASFASSRTTPTAACDSFSAASFGITDDTTSTDSFSGPGPAASFGSAGQAAALPAAQGVQAPEEFLSGEDDSPAGKSRQAVFPRRLLSTSFSIQPTARADPLLIDACPDAEAQEYAAPCGTPSVPGSPLTAVARATGPPSPRVGPRGFSSSRPPSPCSTPSRVSGTREGAVELLPAESAEFDRKGATSGRSGEDGVSTVCSPPAPDAPVVTHVGGGVLQVDLRLSLLGQVVLSLFYASYHTVVLGFLTGLLGGCIALPCVAVLGMIFILLRNSCVFGLLGGVLVHAGVDLGVALVLGAVLQYYT